MNYQEDTQFQGVYVSRREALQYQWQGFFFISSTLEQVFLLFNIYFIIISECGLKEIHLAKVNVTGTKNDWFSSCLLSLICLLLEYRPFV